MPVSANSAAIFSPPVQNRALVLCVIASLALHALALLLPGMRLGAPAPAATHILTATFAPRITAEETPQPAREAATRVEPVAPQPLPPKPEPIGQETEPSVPKAEPVNPKPHLIRPNREPVRPAREPVRSKPEPIRPPPQTVRPRPETAPPQTAVPAPPMVSEPGPTPELPRAADMPATTAVPTARPAPAAAASSGAPAQPAMVGAGAGTKQPGSDVDTGILDRYRLALIESAKRYKRYPGQAMDKGWQGKVEVRLVIGANGRTRSTSIKSSSGYEILDKQALDMVNKAKPLTRIPAALRGREFVVDIPVIFDLQAG